MAKVYQFKQAGFTFNRVNGWNIVPGEIISLYYSNVIHGEDVDPFIIKYYDDEGSTIVIDDGIVMPTNEEEEKALRNKSESILDILRSHGCDPDELKTRKGKLNVATDQANSDASFFLHKSKIYQRHTDAGYDIITLKCGNGCISCGWYDYSKTDNLGLKMSAFMLYSLGFVNSIDEDKHEFWEACHNVLPHSSELNDIDSINQIILDGIEKLAISRLEPVVIEKHLW